jgi:NADH dehydrogenase
MRGSRVTVFGGSGFIGRHLVRRLGQAGASVTVAVRDPEGALFLKPMGDVGQITPIYANVRKPDTVARVVEGADMVVNLVGVLHQGDQTFASVHAEGAKAVAEASAAAGVQSLVQMSAIGADPDSEAQYARTKAAGEAAAREAFPDAVVLRPSVVFGPEDGFLNRFAAMARISPVLPLVGGGETRFQPVFVGDVAHATVAALGSAEARGKTYELGGPRVMSFRQVLEFILETTGRKALLAPLPFGLAKIQGAVLQVLPNPPLTLDQVKLLMTDNVVAEGALTFADLGIRELSTIEAVAPAYLSRYRKPNPLDAEDAA